MTHIRKIVLFSMLLLLSVSIAHAQNNAQFSEGDWVLVTDPAILVYASPDMNSTVVSEVIAGWRTHIVAVTDDAEDRWVYLEKGAYGWVKGEEGLVLYSDEAMQQLIDDANAALQANPDDMQAHLNLGTASYSLRDFDSAVAEYQYVIDGAPEEVDPLRARAFEFRGIAYDSMGQSDIALDDVLNGIGIGRSFPNSYNRMVSVSEAIESDEMSLQYYLENVDRAPDWGLAYNNAGIIYQRLGQYDQAIAYYSQALEHDPDLAISFRNLGGAYYDMGEYDQALENFNAAIRTDSACINCLIRRANYYSDTGDAEAALADYAHAIEIDPLNDDPVAERGAFYERIGDFDSAVIDLKNATRLNPYNVYAWYNLAAGYAHLGRYDEAIAAYEETDNISDRFDSAVTLYAPQVFIAVGDYHTALDYINFYITRIDANDNSFADFHTVAFLTRANIYLYLEDYESAEQDYQNAFDTYYDFAVNYYAYGGGYRVTQAREDNLAHLEDQLAENPDDAELQRQIANIYLELGLWDEGIEGYQQYITLSGTSNADLEQLLDTLQSLV